MSYSSRHPHTLSQKKYGDSKWTSKGALTTADPVQKYDAYLEKLEEQTRAKRQLAEKKSLEAKVVDEKEQGFLLYVNGANSRRSKANLAQPNTSRSNTAFGSRKTPAPQKSEDTEVKLSRASPRARTAPAKRKKWGQDTSVEVLTHRDGRVKLGESMFQYKYSDSFDSDASGSVVESEEDEEDSQYLPDEIHVSLNKKEVSLLRQSLKHNDQLRESIKEELDLDCSSDDSAEPKNIDFNQRRSVKSIASSRSKPYKPSGAFRKTPEPVSNESVLDDLFGGPPSTRNHVKHSNSPEADNSRTSRPESAGEGTVENAFASFSEFVQPQRDETSRWSGCSDPGGSDLDFVLQKFRNLDISQKRALLQALSAEAGDTQDQKALSKVGRSVETSILSSDEENIRDTTRNSFTDKNKTLPTYRVDVSKSYILKCDNSHEKETELAANVNTATDLTTCSDERNGARTSGGSYVCMQSSPQPSGSKFISPETSKSNMEEPESLNTICLKLISNWGDAAMIGLTEVKFFDRLGGEIATERVSVSNAYGQSTSISTVINGKTKTTRSGNMWCCRAPDSNSPVEITFVLPANQVAHKVRIWNYNKSPKELSKGVRHAAVQVNKDIVWHGELEKGCGSQIFDYEQVILLEGAAKIPSQSRMDGFGDIRRHSQAEDEQTIPSSPLHIVSSPSMGESDSSSNDQDPNTTLTNDPQNLPGEDNDTSFSLEELLGCSSSAQPAKPKKTGRKIADISGIFDSLDLGTNEEIRQVQKSPGIASMMDGNAKLDESWSHIFAFEKSRAGQLHGSDLPKIMSQPTTPQKSEQTQLDENPSCASECNMNEDNFFIPELPFGSSLAINILSTWGDRYYVGLNGIELFDKNGSLVKVAFISADPADINVLPEYSKDPRVVKNLIDGVNNTRDDTHMWLAPFTNGQNHLVMIEFAQPTHIAMLRIWNYNKSRVHSTRGARSVEITLDQQLIFKGEIQRAGELGDNMTETYGDTIMFTMDESILYSISCNDELFLNDFNDNECSSEEHRPPTPGDGVRPTTVSTGKKQNNLAVSQSIDFSNAKSFRGRTIVFNFTETWSDAFYLGLTGLQLLDAAGGVIKLEPEMVDAEPRDLNSSNLAVGDVRTLDKLIDGNNVVTDDKHMWLIPFTAGSSHTVTVKLPFQPPGGLTGFRVWNYNKSWEDTFRGAKRAHVTVDGKSVSPSGEGFLLRKAPGHVNYDFGQTLLFSTPEGVGRSPDNEEIPYGFVYCIMLHSSHGDPYYVGLDGIELIDENNKPIRVDASQVDACPRSVNDLQGVSNDVRTPDKLVDGINFGKDGTHSWLAPIFPSIKNKIYIFFNYPQAVTGIRVWNYAKTPTRGAKEISVLVDDMIRYQGVLKPSLNAARGIIPGLDEAPQHQTIDLVDSEAGDQHQPDKPPDGLIDSVKVHATASSESLANQSNRPKTCVPKKR